MRVWRGCSLGEPFFVGQRMVPPDPLQENLLEKKNKRFSLAPARDEVENAVRQRMAPPAPSKKAFWEGRGEGLPLAPARDEEGKRSGKK